ncbi:TonB-dependent receptor [Aquimarina rhabdastrellae]
MGRIIFIVFMLWISAINAQEKKYVIKGEVREEHSKMPLEFATVSILGANGGKVIEGGVTNEKGLFEIEVKPGTYDIKIEYISFKSEIKPQVNIQQDIHLGTIILTEDLAQLSEVNIVAEKTSVSYKLDKKVFNVGKDLVIKGGTISDVLDNVPSVSVDAAGGVSLRGNGNVRILINGKPSVLASAEGLDQIPAESIEKVEVITNPSARYDAEGTAGIINVILKKNKKNGLGGSLQVTTGIPANHGVNLNINSKGEKFNFFTNLGYRYLNYFGEGEQSQQFFENNTIQSVLNQTSDDKNNNNNYNIYFGADYYINEKNTLTLSYYHNRRENNDETAYRYEYLNAQRDLDSITVRAEDYEEPQIANQIEVNYTKTFDTEGKKLTANVQYEFWNDDENERLTQMREFPSTTNITTTRSRDIESSKDLLFQSDFITPLSKSSRLELGIKGEIRRINSDYKVWFNEVLSDELDNLLHYDERIYGAYAQYGNKGKRFQYLLGMRVEHANTGSSDRKNIFNTDKKYTDFFPTVHLTYSINEKTNLQLSYGRRITRPRFWQLNPFGGISDDRNIFGGNPDLDPMYTNALELGGLKRIGKLTLNPAIYYQNSTNFFDFITTRSANGALFTRPVNLGDETRYGAELNLSYNPIKWLNVSGEINYYAFKQDGTYDDISYDNEDKAWFTRANVRMKFPNKLAFQTSFNYTGARQSGQSYTRDQYVVNLGLSKDLWKDKASISLNVNNLFDSRVRDFTITQDNYIVDAKSKRSGTRVSATFTYRFNRKKNERDRLPD